MFGRLKVIFPLGWIKQSGKRRRAALVKCNCKPDNPLIAVSLRDLRVGKKKSCGCLAAELNQKAHEEAVKRRAERQASLDRPQHRLTGTALWRTWAGIHARCYNVNHRNYSDYGGRGITVYEAWHGSRGFVAFREWMLANVGDHPGKGWTLDRIENEDSYEPENLRWATQRDQNRNTRKNVWITYKGQKMLLCDAIRASGLKQSTVNNRRQRGVPEKNWFDPPAPNNQKRRSPLQHISTLPGGQIEA